MLFITLAGTLGGDAQVRHTQGDAAINFSVAHSEKWKDKQGVAQERTTWVSCTIWRKPDQIKIAESLTKGTKVTITGTPSARAWINTADGKALAALEVVVREIDLQGKPASAPVNNTTQPNNSQNESTGAPVFNSSISDNDDLPF